MSPPSPPGPVRLRSLDRALLTLGGCAVAVGLVRLAMRLPGSGGMWWVRLLGPGTCGVDAAAGLLAWHRRPGNRLGMLVALGGFAVLAGSLADTSAPSLVAVGAVTATLVLAVTVHLLIAFPSGR